VAQAARAQDTSSASARNVGSGARSGTDPRGGQRYLDCRRSSSRARSFLPQHPAWWLSPFVRKRRRSRPYRPRSARVRTRKLFLEILFRAREQCDTRTSPRRIRSIVASPGLEHKANLIHRRMKRARKPRREDQIEEVVERMERLRARRGRASAHQVARHLNLLNPGWRVRFVAFSSTSSCTEAEEEHEIQLTEEEKRRIDYMGGDSKVCSPRMVAKLAAEGVGQGGGQEVFQWAMWEGGNECYGGLLLLHRCETEVTVRRAIPSFLFQTSGVRIVYLFDTVWSSTFYK
jgi:hypothetical protein